MSTVFDVEGVDIDGGTVSLFTANGVQSIDIVLDDNPIETVEVQVEGAIETVQVEVPGLQGPPGDQMVYTQQQNPALQYNWGPEDKGKIWIEVDI